MVPAQNALRHYVGSAGKTASIPVPCARKATTFASRQTMSQKDIDTIVKIQLIHSALLGLVIGLLIAVLLR